MPNRKVRLTTLRRFLSTWRSTAKALVMLGVGGAKGTVGGRAKTHLLTQCTVAALAIASADLQHDHHEHGHVEKEDQTEEAHTGGVEEQWAKQPAATHTHTQTDRDSETGSQVSTHTLLSSYSQLRASPPGASLAILLQAVGVAVCSHHSHHQHGRKSCHTESKTRPLHHTTTSRHLLPPGCHPWLLI